MWLCIVFGDDVSLSRQDYNHPNEFNDMRLLVTQAEAYELGVMGCPRTL
jgi:hypothetical protein